MTRRHGPEEPVAGAGPLFAGNTFLHGAWANDATASAKAAEPVPFDGITFKEPRDGGRLRKQLSRVLALMLDGRYRSLAEISSVTGFPESSISARLRDLRKPKFGGYTVDRVYVDRGVWHYRVVAT